MAAEFSVRRGSKPFESVVREFSCERVGRRREKPMRSVFRLALLALAALPSIASVRGAPRYTIDDVVRLAQDQNPEIAIARKKIQAAHGGQVEARSGYLPSVVSSGLYRRRERRGIDAPAPG